MSACFYCGGDAGHGFSCSACRGKLDRLTLRAGDAQIESDSKTIRARCPECGEIVILTGSARYALHFASERPCLSSGRAFGQETTNMIVVEGSLYMNDGKLKALSRDGRTVVVACDLIVPDKYDPNKDQDLLIALNVQTVEAASLGKSIVTHMGGGRIVAVDLVPLKLLPSASAARPNQRKANNGKAH